MKVEYPSKRYGKNILVCFIHYILHLLKCCFSGCFDTKMTLPRYITIFAAIVQLIKNMLELSPYDEDSNIKCSRRDLIFTNTKIIDKS